MRIRLVPPENAPSAWPVYLDMPHAPRIGERILHPHMAEYRIVTEVNYAFDEKVDGVHQLTFVGVKLGEN